MKTIKDYRLKKDCVTTQTLYITSGAEIVNIVDLDFDVALIVVSTVPEVTTELRTFKLCDSHEYIYHDNIKYLGVTKDNQHVIEIL